MTRDSKFATRLYVDNALHAGAVIEFDRDKAHFLSSVLRLTTGAPIRLFNGRDGEWAGSLTHTGKHQAHVVVESAVRPQRTEPNVWVLFSPLKKTRMDMVIEKSTELGASVLWPVFMDRTQAERVNGDRLRVQAVEAAEQCERLSIPDVRTPQDLRQVLNNWPQEQRLYMGAEAGNALPLREAFQTMHPSSAAFLIGPEGGFSPEEQALLRSYPFVIPVHLGPRILRSETAVMAMLSCWQALRGDWNQAPS